VSPLEQTGFEPPVPLAKARVIFGDEKGRRLSAWSRKTSSFSRGDQWFESLLLYQRVSSRLRLRMNSQPILPANSRGCFLAQGMTPRSPYNHRAGHPTRADSVTATRTPCENSLRPRLRSWRKPRAVATPAPVIDLMAALKRGLAHELPFAKGAKARKPPRRHPIGVRARCLCLSPAGGDRNTSRQGGDLTHRGPTQEGVIGR